MSEGTNAKINEGKWERQKATKKGKLGTRKWKKRRSDWRMEEKKCMGEKKSEIKTALNKRMQGMIKERDYRWAVADDFTFFFGFKYEWGFNSLPFSSVQELSVSEGPNYLTACAEPSKLPQRHFCAVCGFPSNYTCVSCGARYCCVRCLATHHETR